ncbi:DUF1990 family protein [Gordonia soli]|uniref:DUF1990 domain-containing protein n=1 Tax=Gordonia soli NBRC 108243 TaxID=1223545 RepID=M0QP56_9ACTN|nr:DUF1990 domain-containing protein [Gordonia soli]GAC70061.1 hypothetical protein GS4_32_00050 [Gordonia soli NBRC 108243]
MADRLRQLAEADERRLLDAAFSYPEVGATAGTLPAGYHHMSVSSRIGSGADVFDRARQAILSWQVQLRSGARVASSASTVVSGAVAVVSLGVGPLRLHAPVRIVEVIDDGRQAGFSYGTLPGHPECGEERFVVDRAADDAVTFTVTAFSRPGSLLTRVGGPAARIAQRLMAERYLRALRS